MRWQKWWLRTGHAALATAGVCAIAACGGSGAGGGDNASAEAGVVGPAPSSSGSGTPDATSTTGNPSSGSSGASASPPAQTDAGAAGPADVVTGPDAAEAATATTDASTSPADADAGPYKGVANSACTDLPRLGVTWFYNWTLSASGCTARPFVPMVWGHTGKEQSAAGITSEVAGIVSAGYGVVLGFNEPDNSSQSNISVTTAISLWPSLTATAGVRVGSPATQANSTGQTWFTSFMKQVNADTTGQLRVDFIAAHWYGWNSGSCDAKAANLESYVKWLEAIPGNRPIWLTEWGCLNQSNPDEATVESFFQGAVAMFAKHPRIERYAWYPWTTNNELVGDGGLTPLGNAFAAAPATR